MNLGLTGVAQSGKDTVAARLIKAHGYTRVAFADGVREMALAIDPIVCAAAGTHLAGLVADYGWEDAKLKKEVRRLLQRIGTEAVRNILGSETWVELGMRKASAIEGPVVFTDVRFPNEADAIFNAGGVTIRVERPGVQAVNAHLSEVAMADQVVEATIVNDGSIEHLYAKVDALMREIRYVELETRLAHP